MQRRRARPCPRGRGRRRQPRRRTALFESSDALNCLDYFGRTATYGQVFDVAAGVHATFIDAGHILGSACIFLELEDQSRRTRCGFGDLGSPGHPLLRSPANPPHAENVVMETTYGDRLHKPLAQSVEEFYGAITDTFKRGRKRHHSRFRFGARTRITLFFACGHCSGSAREIDEAYLDSPMAISATEIFRRHPECFEPATAKLFQEGHDPLLFQDCISRGRPPNPLQ